MVTGLNMGVIMVVKGKLYVALIPLLYAVAAVVVPWIDKGVAPTGAEWVQIAIGVTLAVQVYGVPLVPGHTWVKSMVGAALAGLGALAVVLVGGVTAQEWLDVLVYVLTSLGIVIAPAVSDTGVAVGFGGDAPIRSSRAAHQ